MAEIGTKNMKKRKLSEVIKIPGAVYEAGKAKLRNRMVGESLKNNLMRRFPEGVVGSKNQATISNRLASDIKAGKPENAVKFAQQQTSAIAKRKTVKKKKKDTSKCKSCGK